MSVTTDQIAQAIKIIEAQLAILKQAVGSQAAGMPLVEGFVGIFDGEFMIEESGKRHQVPPNYASKTMLVPGDTVKMTEDPNGGQSKFKQIGKVERSKSNGILVKKDGKFEVLTEDGSFKVLSAAIKHYNGEVGDLVYVQYPKNHVKGSFAAVEKVVSQHENITPSSGEGQSLPGAATTDTSDPKKVDSIAPAPAAPSSVEPIQVAISPNNDGAVIDSSAALQPIMQGEEAPQPVLKPEVSPLDDTTPNIVATDDDELV